MDHDRYQKLKTITVANYALSTVYDFVISVFAFTLGYVEMNPLYAFVGPAYWTIYWTLSIALPVLLLEFGNRWSFLLLWVTTITHLICTFNNVNLLRGGL